LTEDNFKLLLDLYAQWVIELGPERAKDQLFEHMLTSETLVNMMFFLAVDKLNEIIEKSPAGSVKAFVKNFCGVLR
jgi:hypothetical protein